MAITAGAMAMSPTTHHPFVPLSPGPPAKSLDHGFASGAIGVSALVAVLFSACGPRSSPAQSVTETPQREIETVDVREATDLLAVLSPDGGRVALLILGQPWIVDREGGRAVPLTDSADVPTTYFALAWGPDSRRLAAWFWEGDADRRGIRIFDLDSGRARVLPEPRDLLGLSWTPEGDALLLATADGDSTVVWRWVLSHGTADPIGAIAARADDVAFAPRGDLVAYTVGRGPPEATGLWEMRLATGSLRRLTDAPLPARPGYSPAQDRIAFLSGDAGERALWLVERANGTAVPLIQDAEDVHDAPLSWSPAGDSLLYGAAGAMHLVSTRGGPPVTGRMIEFVATHRVARWAALRRPSLPEPGERRTARGIVTPSLSPDGRHVAFAALGDLWLADVTGGNGRRLTRSPAEEIRPRWSPDGSRIAFFTASPGADVRVGVLDTRRGSTPHTFELPEPVNLNLGLAWHPAGDRVAYAGTESLTRGFFIGTIALEDGKVSVLHRGGGLGGSLIGWSPDGEHVVFARREYDASAFRYRQRVHRLTVSTGREETWDVAGKVALRSGWTPDLSRVAYSVAGRGYWADVSRTGDAVPLSDPVPRDFSWSADGGSLLYRSGARTRLLDVAPMAERTVELGPEYDVPVAPPPILLRRVRVIDGRGAPATPPVDVLVERGRIAAIRAPGTLYPDSVREIDGEGLTLLPGLINLHVHAGLQQQPSAAFLYFGTTTVRDAGTESHWMRARAERAEAENVVGPRVFFTGGMIEGETDHGWADRPTVDALDTANVRALVTSLAELGAAAIKIRIGNPPLDRLLAAVAHEVGLPITSHYVYPGTVATGLEGKEHASLYYRETASPHYRDDVLRLLAAGGTCVTPTLMAGATSSFLLSGHDPDLRFPAGTIDDLAPFVTPATVDFLRRSLPPQALDRMGRNLRVNLANAGRMRRAGVTVTAGTDAGRLDPRLDLELMLLMEAGFTPLEAIRTATLNGARCLGLDGELGSVEVGKRADLILVRGDPATDLRALRRIEHVLLGGRAYARGDLLPAGPPPGGR